MAVGAALLGLAVGSFLNVVAHRVPSGRSVIRPASTCPACAQPIRPADNLPVVSWLLLGGRCRDCRAPISPRYPLVEAATGVGFAAAVLVVGPSWVLPAYLCFVAVTLVLILTDLDHHRIPNRILYPGTGVGTLLLLLGAAVEGEGHRFLQALGGGLLYFVLLFLIALVARGGFGLGDVKLSFLLGEFLAFLSWGTLGTGVFLAFTIGGLTALALLLAGRKTRKDAMPFGPALIAGTWLAIPFGEQLVRWYLA
ncbi:MAG: prepilin peptidase [Actinomycetota bacterium]|nr:prepilin peptidase [Actinomycetota bacterium]